MRFSTHLHNEECFKHFLIEVNNMHPLVEFTADWSYRSVSFLDVSAIINGEGQIIIVRLRQECTLLEIQAMNLWNVHVASGNQVNSLC